MIADKGSETFYISDVNGNMKVKSDAQVAMNKILNPAKKIFSLGIAEGTALPTEIIPNVWNCP